VINPGGWTHTSVALRDALVIPEVAIVEVHISNVHAREPFRHHSYVSTIASAVIAGAGIRGYEFAIDHLASN
jgi:3-dehydroquinate dehydratase-2